MSQGPADIHPSIHRPSILLSIHPCIHLFIHPAVHPSIHPPITLFSQYMLLKLTLSQALFWSLRTTVNKTGKLSAPWELHLKGSIPETSQITHYALQVETDGSSLSYEGSVLPSPPALIHTDTFTVDVNVPQGVHAYVCSQCICLDTSVSTRSLGIHTH